MGHATLCSQRPVPLLPCLSPPSFINIRIQMPRQNIDFYKCEPHAKLAVVKANQLPIHRELSLGFNPGPDVAAVADVADVAAMI